MTLIKSLKNELICDPAVPTPKLMLRKQDERETDTVCRVCSGRHREDAWKIFVESEVRLQHCSLLFCW